MQGLVIDLREVRNVICNADRQVEIPKKESQLRCHIKIRLRRGNIHLFLREEDVHKWTCAIMRGSSMKIEEEDDLTTAIEANKDSEDSVESSDSDEFEKKVEESEEGDRVNSSIFAEKIENSIRSLYKEIQKEEEIEVKKEKKWWTRSLRC